MLAGLNHWLERLFNLAVSRTSPTSDRERRSRSIVRGTAAALVARAIGSLTGIITVPLTVRYLGAERYGAWMTISSVLIFLGFGDFGLASSLTNALSRAFGENNRESARRYVTTTLAALSVVALLFVIAGITFAAPIARLMFPTVDSSLRAEIIPTLIIALSIFALNFPLLVTNRVLAAYQENATANLWVMASSVANLTGILIVIAFRGGLPALLLGSAGSGMLVNAISTIWLFGWHKPWLAPALSAGDLKFARELFSTSWKFFITNVAWLVNSQTDSLIIAHYLGPSAVTPYNVTFRLFAYATLLQSLTSSSLWPTYTEAAARKDYAWIHGMYRKNLKFNVLIGLGLVGVLIACGRTVIRVWATAAAVPPPSFLIWMGIWNVLLSYLYVASCLLNATGKVTGMMVYGVITALLNVGLSIWLVQPYGISGVIAATVLAYVVACCTPIFFDARRVLAKLSPQCEDTAVGNT